MTDHTTLIDAATLADLIAPDSPHRAHTVVLDTRFDLAAPARGPAAFGEGHVPGARYAHLDEDLSGPVTPTSGRHPLPPPDTLAARFASWGVNADTQLVVYDDAAGAMAARAWWLARWLGHPRVAVLDGGLAAWRDLGLPMSTEVPTPTSSGAFTATRDDTMWLSTDDVARGLADGSLLLVDARANVRFTGEREPIDPVAGHVPGAVNLPFEQTLAADGTLLDVSALAARFSAILADHSPDEMAAMCGSGVTACHLLLGMQHAGLPGGRLYAGSWSEWIRDPARPVASAAD
jgi:thiosulfate/3-mercaptopyruvate sulfurtransferase